MIPGSVSECQDIGSLQSTTEYPNALTLEIYSPIEMDIIFNLTSKFEEEACSSTAHVRRRKTIGSVHPHVALRLSILQPIELQRPKGLQTKYTL